MGAPVDLEDGRLMGGYLEMYLQAMGVSYEIEALMKMRFSTLWTVTPLQSIMQRWMMHLWPTGMA